MARRAHVREHVRRTGDGHITAVREHERTIDQVDRRERIVDAIRTTAARRRRFEEYAINEALVAYADARIDGEGHEEAMRLALQSLDDEMNSSDHRFDEADVLRIRAELEALVVKANGRGYKQGGDASPRAPHAAKLDSKQDIEQERMMSINDAVSDEDQTFSFADVLDDGDEKDDRHKGGRERRQGSELPGIIDVAADGMSAAGAAARRAIEKQRARDRAVEEGSKKVAIATQKHEAAMREDRMGIKKNYDREKYGAPPGTSVTTRKRTAPTVWSGTIDDIPDVPPTPVKGTGRLDE